MSLLRKNLEGLAPKQVFNKNEPQRLMLRHVRSIFRLLFEVRDLGSSPLAWRRHMVTGLLKLADGATGIAAEVIIPKKLGNPRLLGTVIGGVSDPRLVSVYRALVEKDGYPLDLRREDRAKRTNTTFRRTRQQMAENRAWSHRPDLDPWRTLDCEYFICSNQYLPNRHCIHLIILTRPGRDRPFGKLEQRIVGLFHAELGRLWRHVDDDSTAELPSSLQHTLELLLEGSSEGQIVAKLRLSPHTVHDHVKRLYRHFAVNSRAQLLAHLSHSPLIRAPRLCVNLLQSDDDRRFDTVGTVETQPGQETPSHKDMNPGLRVAQL